MNRLIYFLALAALSLATTQAFAQATINENQTTYLYVSAILGSDANTGSSTSPVKTIGAAASKAVANNAKGIGTKVYINPGVYREFVYITSTRGQTGATITFQGAPGQVFIDGSDVVSGWQGVSSTEYVHPWQVTSGCPTLSGWTAVQAIVLRSEMVFVNGQPLTQILDSSDQRAGTFFVDAANQQMHVWPPAGTDMTTALVEVASRPETLEVHGRSNMVFRGLVFQHAATCPDMAGANVFSSSNILIDKVQANWNNWSGLSVSTSTNITVQNSAASHNGGSGLSSFESKNALYQYNETDYNNWRGAMGALYDWSMGGTKLMRMHNGQVLQHVAYRNQAQGLWFDTDNKNIVISNAKLSENTLSNLQMEANEGPVALTNSSLCSGGLGIAVVNTAGLTITGNNFYNNGGTAKWQAQLFLAGNPGGRSISDWETGQPYHLYTSSTTLANNVFTDGGTGQYLFSTYLSGNDLAQFIGSLHSSPNTWNDPLITKAFKLGKDTTLSGWQNVTGQDQSSSWAPSTQSTKNCAVPAPAYADFAVSTDKRAYLMSKGLATINLQARSFGLAGATLSTGALPTGVSASFSTPTVTSGLSVLTLTASSNAAYQNVPVTIFATNGDRVHSVTVTVTVSSY